MRSLLRIADVFFERDQQTFRRPGFITIMLRAAISAALLGVGAIPAIAQYSSMPSSFTQACTELQGYLDTFNTTLKCQWNGSKPAVIFGLDNLASVSGGSSGNPLIGAGVGSWNSQGMSAPVINSGGVVNAANYVAKGVAGMIGSIFGTNLASVTMAASSTPLPTSLGGVSVHVGIASGTVLMPLFYVSPTQINFQLPWNVPVNDIGIDTVTVSTNQGVSGGASLPMLRFAPAIFSLDSSGSGPGAILISNTANLAQPAGSVAGRTASPAQRGGYISIYCTGLGDLKEMPPANGAAAPAGMLFNVAVATTVSIGGIQVTPSFAGLAPGFVGLYQVDALIPASVAPGSTVPVLVTVGGVSSSNTVTIAVQ